MYISKIDKRSAQFIKVLRYDLVCVLSVAAESSVLREDQQVSFPTVCIGTNLIKDPQSLLKFSSVRDNHVIRFAHNQ